MSTANAGDFNNDDNDPRLGLSPEEWQRYWDQLERYARKVLNGAGRTDGDSSDVATSVLRTLLRRVNEGELPIAPDPCDLWPVLRPIVRKKSSYIRNTQRKKDNNTFLLSDAAAKGQEQLWTDAFEDRPSTGELEDYLDLIEQKFRESLGDEELVQIARLWRFKAIMR